MSEARAIVDCNNCVFFSSIRPLTNGECKRYPPVIVAGTIPSDVCTHPIVHPNDWCGEFKPKEEK